MLDIVIIFLLLAGLIVGFKRGVIVQGIHMIGIIIGLLVASLLYRSLAQFFVLWVPYSGIAASTKVQFDATTLDLDSTFYRLIAFILLFFLVKLLVHIIASAFNFLEYAPTLQFNSRLIGAGLGFLEFYLLTYFVLAIFYFLPVDFIQTLFRYSFLSTVMIEYTPLVSMVMQNMWYVSKN